MGGKGQTGLAQRLTLSLRATDTNPSSSSSAPTNPGLGPIRSRAAAVVVPAGTEWNLDDSNHKNGVKRKQQ